MLKRSMLFLLLCFVSVACKEHRLDQIKSFRLFVETDDSVLQNSVRVLVKSYNQRIGFEALSIVDTREDSNSVISFRKGLIEDGRKLGLGQWTTMKTMTSKGYIEKTETTTIEYGMEIVFDQENFAKKSAFVDASDSDEFKHLFHLFTHEVGHGMQLDHSDSKDSVMYPSIPEKEVLAVNYDLYFQEIRSFMNNPAEEKAHSANDCAVHKHTRGYER